MKRYTLTESKLRSMIREAVKSVLNEQWGGSSANGYGYNYSGNYVQNNSGGAYGGSGLDRWHDSNQAYKSQQAERDQKNRRIQEYVQQYLNSGYSEREAYEMARKQVSW